MDNEVKGRGKDNCQLIDVKMVNESGKEEDEEAERIVRSLLILERPKGLGDGEFASFKREAMKYLIRDGVLYRRGRGGHRASPPRKVISHNRERGRI